MVEGGFAVSFEVAAGEILGIAGIDGNGQKQLAEALAGQRRALGGDILLDERPITGLDVGSRRRLGLRYVTDDRLGEGTVAGFPVSTQPAPEGDRRARRSGNGASSGRLQSAAMRGT